MGDSRRGALCQRSRAQEGENRPGHSQRHPGEGACFIPHKLVPAAPPSDPSLHVDSQIQLNDGQKYTFSSFIGRDSAFRL